MNPPKAVIFDLGKVLLDFDYGIAIQRLAMHARAGEEAIRKVLLQDSLLVQYECGRLTSQAFYEEFARAVGYAAPFETFRTAFGEIFSPIEPMIGLHARLRDRGVATWILSNTNEIAITHIRERFPFCRSFTGCVLSYEHGAMKPDESLYRVVERGVGAPSQELFYLDDRPENLTTAWRLGWRGAVHETVADSLAACRKVGLPVD